MCFLENRLANGKWYDRDLCCLYSLIQKNEATEADIVEYTERISALKKATQNKNRKV